MLQRKNKSKLWTESPTTICFTTPLVNFTHSERFKRDSIYWPPRNQMPISAIGLKNIWDEDIKSISKRIDDEERQERLTNMSRQERRFSFISRPLQDRRQDRRSSLFTKDARSTMSSFNSSIVNRLFQKQPKGPLSPQRDRGGLRCDEIVNGGLYSPNVQMSLNKTQSSGVTFRKRGFSLSKRLDLARPQNFNPGPGAYKIVRFLEDQSVGTKDREKPKEQQ